MRTSQRVTIIGCALRAGSRCPAVHRQLTQARCHAAIRQLPTCCRAAHEPFSVRPDRTPMNTPDPHPDAPRASLADRLRALPGALLRLGLGVLGIFLMLGALLVGAMLALGLLGWALLRGRRLPPGTFSAAFQRQRGFRREAKAPGAVIDVEARVVADEPHQRETEQR
jgi:hypothetical protein